MNESKLIRVRLWDCSYRTYNDRLRLSYNIVTLAYFLPYGVFHFAPCRGASCRNIVLHVCRNKGSIWGYQMKALADAIKQEFIVFIQFQLLFPFVYSLSQWSQANSGFQSLFNSDLMTFNSRFQSLVFFCMADHWSPRLPEILQFFSLASLHSKIKRHCFFFLQFTSRIDWK